MNNSNNKKLRPIYLMLVIGLTIIPVVLLWSAVSTALDDSVPLIPGTGYRDFSYYDEHLAKVIIKEPTGTKPESKLWWNDGYWWASMYYTPTNAFHIYKLQWGTQTWVDTGVQLDDTRDPDDPKNVKADTLWDETAQKLYVLSHVYSESPSPVKGSSHARLYRYSYDAVAQTYTLDPGFEGPGYVTVNEDKTETLVLDKDSNGRLWTTFVSKSDSSSTGYELYMNASDGSDDNWLTKFTLPPGQVPVTATEVLTDDISTLVAYDNQIAVIWTNQTEAVSDTLHVALHNDATSSHTSGWQYFPVTLPAGLNIDDHLSSKSVAVNASGQLFVALKLHGGSGTDPEIGMIARDTDGTFSFHKYSTTADRDTRPILVLDEDANKVYIFVVGKPGGSQICYKSLDLPAAGQLDTMGDFDAGDCGLSFIEDKTNFYNSINNPTSMKRNANATTGIVVLASDDDDATGKYYFHNVMGDPPPVVDVVVPIRSGIDVPVTSTVKATFSKDMNAATITTGSFIVKGNGGPLSGVVTYNAASKTATFTPDQPLASNGTYTVELTQSIQDAGGQSLNAGIEFGSVRETWQFVTQGPKVQFDNTGYTVNEADVATITVILESPSPEIVTVDYKSAIIPANELPPGTGAAVPGVDYTTVSDTLSFPAGVTSQTFNVTTLNNAIADGQKALGLELSNPVGSTLGEPYTSTLTIFDDETLTVRFQNAEYTVNEGDGTATIELTLSPASIAPVTVNFSTADGTATAPEDYTAVTSQEVKFEAGDTTQSATVSIVNDSLNELNETVSLILDSQNPADVVIANSPATLVILDNDPEPSVKFKSDKYTVDESAGKVTLEVELSAVSGRQVTVVYETGGGTATPGVDYEPAMGTLIFEKGQTVQSFVVNLIDDFIPDTPETFNVGLSDPDGAKLGVPTAAEVTITDDDTIGVLLPVIIKKAN